jgi:aflatoxin B1 aldehyde reductase
LPTVYQGRYNLITRDVEPELFPCLRKFSIRFYAYNPLCGGLLNGKQNIDQELPGRFDPSTKQGSKYRERFWNAEYFDAVQKLQDVCAKYGLTVIEVAHRWLMNHSLLTDTDGTCCLR